MADEVGGDVVESGPVSRVDAGSLATDIRSLPPSKLPAGQQFQVLRGWVTADMDFSNTWRAEAKFWYEFRSGEHWTPEDKALLDEQERPHIVFNRVLAILKAVAGMEINGRHETAFLPRGTEDTKPNEILSAASRWMSDSCDGEDEESQAFEDTITCGMGWVEERMSYEDDPSGLYVEEEIDPLEMYWDRAARKKNLSNARRMARVRRMPLGDALAMFPGKTRDDVDAGWAVDGPLEYPQKSIEQKWKRDEDNVLDPSYNDLAEVNVVQIQWIEKETYYLVADDATNKKAELSESEYRTMADRARQMGIEFVAARLQRKLYKQAFLGGDSVLIPAHDAPMRNQFSWKCITGEHDKVKGTWFGLVKTMRDPQMWANKWLSQILHILNTTAKGGILAERSAFDDERDAEESLARQDRITWLADGAMSSDKPKIMEKPGGGKVDAYLGLLTFAVEAIPSVVGLNMELLGQRDINQPGVLEAMRKQAGMTILATLFDSLRRFRKQIGRGRLFFIQNYLSDGRMIRITGSDNPGEMYKPVQLAKDKTFGLYDVEIADAPTSPNQKEQNWAIIQPMLAAFKDQLMANPQIFSVLIEYSPLPTRIVDAIKQIVMQQQNDPEQQRQQQENRQLLVASEIAKINKDQSTAEMQNAKAGSSQATALYDIAMAHNMMEDNLREKNWEGAKQMIDLMKAHTESKKVENDSTRVRADAISSLADASHTRASADNEQAAADRERTGTALDVVNARTQALQAHASRNREVVGTMIDGLVGGAQAHRHHAAAAKDLAAARQIQRTPVNAGTK